MSESDTFDDAFEDFSIGLVDGLTVPLSVSAGMYAAGASRNLIIIGIVAEMTAGVISMGLADYLAVDSSTRRKEVAWKAGLRTSIGYFIGSLVPLISYLISSSSQIGFRLSIVANLIALVLFGIARSTFDGERGHYVRSITKVVTIGVICVVITFYISKEVRKLERPVTPRGHYDLRAE